MVNRGLSIVTIFLGSFLLFCVQPMLGRTLLPSFGGTASVWVVCLAAYQTLLLVGYFYAHRLASLPLNKQRLWHGLCLTLSLFWTVGFVHLLPAIKNFIGNSAQPAIEVLCCVILCVGPSYIVLASGSSLLQSWLAKKRGREVYKLYAMSNAGSFCGLLFYPFILEPCIGLTAQWHSFVIGFALYMICIFLVEKFETERSSASVRLSAYPQEISVNDERHANGNSSVNRSRFLSFLWFMLPAMSVFMLNAVTVYLTTDVMPLPLLWVVLLGAFLLSYVIGFTTFTEKSLSVWAFLALVCVAIGVYSQGKTGNTHYYLLNFFGAGGVCLMGGIFIHGLLYRLRPNTGLLTRYYLYNACGGACGGLTASLVSPMVFTSVAEYPITLMGITMIVGGYGVWAMVQKHRIKASVYLVGACFVSLMFGYRATTSDNDASKVIYRARGFYGLTSVSETCAGANTAQGVIREFVHGSTIHGIQALIPGKERMPTTYYTETGGGFAIINHPKWKSGLPMRVGLVGAGVGVMTAYCRTNDYYRCYEINPNVMKIATNSQYFTFISDIPGKADVVPGDVRKALEREVENKETLFDVLIIDAFTGDSIPYHLSTREAFEIYFKRLNPNGILAVNLSNWHLELRPYAKSVTAAFNCSALGFYADKNLGKLAFASIFVVYCRQPGTLSFPSGVRLIDFKHVRDTLMPTDEKGSFTKFINW